MSEVRGNSAEHNINRKLHVNSGSTCWTKPYIIFTVTDLANSCATPLFRRPQASQGCLEKQNNPLSWNLVGWCAKIGPKTKKVQKTSELTKKNVKNDGFSTVFRSFSVLGPILAHQTTKYELSGWFRFSSHPREPWGRLNSGVAQELAKLVTVIFKALLIHH